MNAYDQLLVMLCDVVDEILGVPGSESFLRKYRHVAPVRHVRSSMQQHLICLLYTAFPDLQKKFEYDYILLMKGLINDLPWLWFLWGKDAVELMPQDQITLVGVYVNDNEHIDCGCLLEWFMYTQVARRLPWLGYSRHKVIDIIVCEENSTLLGGYTLVAQLYEYEDNRYCADCAISCGGLI